VEWEGTFCSRPHSRDEAAQRLRCASLIAVIEIKIGREVASEEEYELLRSSLHVEGDLTRRSTYNLSTRHPVLLYGEHAWEHPKGASGTWNPNKNMRVIISGNAGVQPEAVV
jgi:hypothetical protein